MAITAAAAAASASICLSSCSRNTSLPSSSSASAVSLASSSSLFFSSDTLNRSGLGLVVRARKRTKYGYKQDDGSRRRGMSCNSLFGLGVPELVVIAGVVALVFGPKNLPEVGRSFGKTIKGFQQAAKEFETELKKDPEAATEQPATEKVVAESGEEKQKTLAVSGEERKEASVASSNQN